MWAMSSAYQYKYSNVIGIRPMYGGFTLGPSRSHSRSHVAVAELFFMFCAHIQPIRRARLFASMSIKPQPLVSSASVESILVHGTLLPSICRQLSGYRRGCREHLGRVPYFR